MPYYRIVIRTKNRKHPYQGIRLIENSQIDLVHNQIEKEVYRTVNESLVIDWEVAMLSKNSKVVRAFIQSQAKGNKKPTQE